MNGEAIQADTLSALVSQHAIRETVVGRVVGIGRKQPIIAAAALPTASDVGLVGEDVPKSARARGRPDGADASC